MNVRTIFLSIALWCMAGFSAAQSPEPVSVQDNQPIAKQLQALRKELVELNRDLFVLEEDLLFPSSTQVVVYLSMDVGTYFKLDSVELRIDDKVVDHYLYTERQVDALNRGGVQRLHIGNLAQGEHQLTAFFTGMGPKDREYKQATAITFSKGSDAKAFELIISDSTSKQQAVFSVVEL
ncbi:hypothetical protein [Aliiglaciecola sp. LCG003]|uniref:hypothetical protein n=1 Tax=Aliiglaciecola sp. LCG003 TaxID=3053655 RepID=UPI002573DC71|nr:hypothetical protein [Aliiglaciecola sp. LCG003]WJG08756.1 hypothetical protein QR722_15635 [Aliiglaciecola sp. LCG003]